MLKTILDRYEIEMAYDKQSRFTSVQIRTNQLSK